MHISQLREIAEKYSLAVGHLPKRMWLTHDEAREIAETDLFIFPIRTADGWSEVTAQVTEYRHRRGYIGLEDGTKVNWYNVLLFVDLPLDQLTEIIQAQEERRHQS